MLHFHLYDKRNRLALALGIGLITSCNAGGEGGDFTSRGNGGSSPDTGVAGGANSTGGSGVTIDAGTLSPTVRPEGPFTDFPAAPVLDHTGGQVPKDIATQFAQAPRAGSGPCVIEPEDGSMFPRNWLRPRVRVSGPSSNAVHEIRISTDNQVNPLVVYTRSSTWTLTQQAWDSLRQHSFDGRIEVAVRSASLDGNRLSGSVTGVTEHAFRVAPVAAEGSVVYWTTEGYGLLMGFEVGDDNVVQALSPEDAAQASPNQQTPQCIGCHTSTPDGKAAAFNGLFDGIWGDALASVDDGRQGQAPGFISDQARDVIGAQLAEIRPVGIMTFSEAYWTSNTRLMVAQVGTAKNSELYWFDLTANSGADGELWGRIARNGDSLGAGAPVWSDDGSTIVYVSSTASIDGRLGSVYEPEGGGDVDLRAIPFNEGDGGTSRRIPISGSDEFFEYYPALSADDQLLAFNRIRPMDPNPAAPCPQKTGCMYDAPTAELYAVPIEGGTPLRLKANDPPTCSGRSSPGITNSWPKWSPSTAAANGKSYYWLMFSSRRTETGNPQLYLAAVERDHQSGELTSHSAVYLWNQPGDQDNHTPAWDVFEIPVVPPR